LDLARSEAGGNIICIAVSRKFFCRWRQDFKNMVTGAQILTLITTGFFDAWLLSVTGLLPGNTHD